MAIVAAALHLILALLALEPAPYAGGDNATYVALARSILERGDYTEIWDPAMRPATLYPPVFPLILAGALSIGASSWVALKVVMAMLSAAAVALSVLWLARVSTTAIAALGGLLLAALPGILEQTQMVLSEIPFWGFAMLALWAFAVYEARVRDDGARTSRMLAIAALATALAWLTRSAGVALALALALRLLLMRRNRDALLFGAIALPPVFAWWLRGRLLAPHGYSRYLLLEDPYRPELGRIGVPGLIPRALENAGTYLTELAPLLFAGHIDPTLWLATALIALALVRWAWRLVRERGAAELWLLCYGGLVLIWPQSWAGERFVLPIAPLLFYYAADAVRALARWRPERARAIGWAAAAVALLVVIPGTVQRVRFAIGCRSLPESAQAFPCTLPVWRELFEVAVATRGNLEPDAIVISRKPTLFFELSGYRSSVYPWSSDPDDFFALVDSTGADYVVLDASGETATDYLVPVLEARSDDFCVIPELSLNRAVLLKVDRAGARPMTQQGAAEGQVRFRTCAVPA